MNILDIAENSVSAGAKNIGIRIVQNLARQCQTLVITDDGKGMSAEMVQRVTDPFTTTRTTRKVGLGLPFLKMAAQQTGGDLHIESAPGKGATVTATFTLGHIDLMPLGDVGSTMATLVQASPELNFEYHFIRGSAEFAFSTEEARQLLDGVPLNTPEVVLFIKNHVNEGTQDILHTAAEKENLA